MPVTEEKKNIAMVQELYDRLIEKSAKRNMTLISIGGGIVQDVTGFLASTLYRGIKWVFVPTTLLAQADSCIGGKTSLNYKAYKNLIGTFYPPTAIFIDTKFLLTLKDLDFYSGLGEVIKLFVIGGEKSTKGILEWMPALRVRNEEALEKAVYGSLLIKKSYIEDDEFDSGRRNMLNFGHCFGHALEAASDFGIPHGQAVVLGMVLANIVARERNLLAKDTEQYLLNKLFLPSLIKNAKLHSIKPDQIIDGMKKDKKRTVLDLPLVMLTDSYLMTRVSDLKEQEVNSALSELSRIM